MARDLIRLMHALFQPSACREPCWHPSADVYRALDGWLVKFDLAGVRPEDVRVSIRGRRVTVADSRRDRTVEEGHCHYRLEIAYSQFERSVELPAPLDRAGVSTEYRDGMLLVRIQTEEANRDAR